MASAGAFSPKNFQVFIKAESTAGTTVLANTGMLALDVDSVGFPTLNTNQVTDVRTSAVRLFKADDFFSDNTMRVTELSLSGTLHNDSAHKLLLGNITNASATPYNVVSNSFSPYSAVYGTTTSSNGQTFTLAIKSPDHTDGNSIVMLGCVCTNLSISADTGTEGGRYKFSATIQTGKNPVLNEASTLAGGTAYSGTDISLPTASVKKVDNTDVVLSSFNTTIDFPAVFSGTSSTGYEVLGRGQELSVTTEVSMKYDSDTRGLVNKYDAGTAMTTNAFVLTNSSNYDITIKNAVFTDVSWNEGDIMMINASMKATASGSDNLISVVTG